MLLLMIIVLLLMCMLIYKLNGSNFFTPSVFMISTFIISSIACYVNADIWNVDFQFDTLLVICSGIFVFAIGDLIAYSRPVYIKTRLSFQKLKEQDAEEIKIRPIILTMAIVLMAITLFFYFRYIYRISLVAGNPLGYVGMFKYARYAVVNTKYDVSPGMVLSHGLIISRCLGYLFLFIVMYNRILFKKIKITYLIPCVLYMLQITISTARLDYISYLCGGVVFYFLLSMRKTNWNRHLNMKSIGMCIGGVFLVFIGFRLLGNLTEKSITRELWSDISVYAGSSIAALNKYLMEPKTPNSFFGQETLRNVYKMMYSAGLTDIKPYNVTLSFINLSSDIRTNIYTAFRRLIQDYGYLGMYIIMLFEGWFYGQWTGKMKRATVVGVGTVIYAYMFYPVVYNFLEEKFVLNFTTINLVYHLIYFYVLYRVFIGKNIKINRGEI